MVIEGTVVNGMIVLDAGASLPEGVRVRVELSDNPDDVGPPSESHDREMELAILRESIEETKAGIGGVEARQFLKDLAISHNLPLQPGE